MFAKASRPERVETEEDADPVVKEIIHDTSFETPQLDSFGRRKDEAGTQVA